MSAHNTKIRYFPPIITIHGLTFKKIIVAFHGVLKFPIIIFRRNFAPSMVVLPRPCWMVLKHQIQTHILNLMCTRWSGVNGCYSL